MVTADRLEAESRLEEAWALRDQDQERAIELAASVEDGSALACARAAVVRAFVYFRRGQLQDAFALAIDAINFFDDEQPSAWQGRISNTAAAIYSSLGLSDQAVHYLIVGNQQSQLVGDHEITFSCLHNLAIELGEAGDLDGAVENFDQAEALAEYTHDGHAFLAMNRCQMYLDRGDVAKALEMIEVGREYWQEPGTQARIYGLFMQVRAAIAANDPDAARAAVEAATAEFGVERAGEELVLGEARVRLMSGDPDGAERVLRANDLAEPDSVLEDVRMAAMLAELQINIAEARGDYRHALSIARARAAKERTERELRMSRTVTLLTNENNRQLQQKSDLLKAQNEQLSQAMTELQEMNEQIRELAVRDHLTGLHNRRYLSESGDALVKHLDKAGQESSLLVFDVDDFKAINDTFLHAAGDAVLRHLTELLRVHTRSNDVLCRLGGDEFVVILPETSLDAAEVIAERIQVAVMDYPWSQIADGLHVGISIGATSTAAGATLDEMLFAADSAMYRAKSAGKNQVQSSVQ